VIRPHINHRRTVARPDPRCVANGDSIDTIAELLAKDAATTGRAYPAA
jgi:hypothetical protein